MTGLLLAHHGLAESLPAVLPVLAIVSAFAGIVVADRRRTRRERAREGDQAS